MERAIAEDLMNALERHPGIIKAERGLFLNILVYTEVRESSRFYEVVSNRRQLVQEADRYHYLSLRRVLRNRNARDYRLSPWKKAYEAIMSALGVYSSDALTRNLRARRELVELMAECDKPFSLLGKLQTYDFDNPAETLFVVTKPVLVIPDRVNSKAVEEWEKANTTYEKEVGFLLRHTKKVNPWEYFSR